MSKIETLYHGTDKNFKDFDFSFAKPNKDFGKGFYLTSNIKQARSWATKRNPNDYYIQIYKIDEEIYNKLVIHKLLCYNKDWVDYIVACRIEGYEEIGCDLVLDRIADSLRGNEIVNFLERYKRGKVTFGSVIKQIQWEESNDQWCFKTLKGVSSLKLERIIHFI